MIIRWPAERLSATQEGLCAVELLVLLLFLLRTFYVWIQEECPNKFHGINEQHTETLEDLDIDRKMIFGTDQAVIACLEVDDDYY
jgi:hypothetical protein